MLGMISIVFTGAHNQKQRLLYAYYLLSDWLLYTVECTHIHIFHLCTKIYLQPSMYSTSKLDRFNSNKKAMQSFKYMQEPQTTAINLYCTLHCQQLWGDIQLYSCNLWRNSLLIFEEYSKKQIEYCEHCSLLIIQY